MLLSLVIVDLQMQCRQFSCCVFDLESALDAASQISSKAHVLLEASIIYEKEKKMVLPVTVFDGGSFSQPLKQLEAQWQRVLSKPVNCQSVHTQWLIELARQHITFQQNRIDNLEVAINRISHYQYPLERMDNTLTRVLSSGESQYVKQIKMYQRQLACAQLNHSTAVKRLDYYQARLYR